MKRAWYPVVAAALVLLCAAPSLAMTFKIATVAPEGSLWIVEMRKAAETISARTTGRVNFKFYPGGVMGNEKSMLRKIRIGQLHGGMFTGGGLEDVCPDLRLYSLPLFFDNLDEVDYVRARFDPILEQRLEENGFVSFGFAEGGFGMFMGNIPLRDVSDLEGQKIWVPEGDRVYYAAMEALGLSPVPLPITDVLTGLQTGLVDIVGTSPIGALVFQWQTRVKYLATTPLSYIIGVFAIDRRSFERLSPADQKIVREVMEPVMRMFDAQNRKDNQDAYQALLDQGIVAHDQDPKMIAKLRTLTRNAILPLSEDGLFDRDLWMQMENYLLDYRRQHTR